MSEEQSIELMTQESCLSNGNAQDYVIDMPNDRRQFSVENESACHGACTHTKDFFATTSLKGVSKVSKSNSCCLKAFWVIGTALGFGIGLCMLTKLTLEYFSHQFVMTLEHRTDIKPPFPDITICNRDVLRGVALFTDTSYKQFIAHVPKTHKYVNRFGQYQLEERKDSRLTSIPAYLRHVLYNSVLERRFQKRGAMNNLIHRCQWYDWTGSKLDSKLCTQNSIYLMDDKELGTCFTIHPNEHFRNEVSKLEAIVYLNNFETNFANPGVRVFIHQTGTFHNLRSQLDVEPGKQVQLNLKPVHLFEWLGKPYDNCTNKEDLDDNYIPNITNDIYPKKKYSKEAAASLCMQYKTIEQCECVNPKYLITPHILERMSSESLFPCSTFAATQSRFNSSINETIKNLNCSDAILSKDDCLYFKKPCKELEYEFEYFYIPWLHWTEKIDFYDKEIYSSGQRRMKFGKIPNRPFQVFKEIADPYYDNQEEVLRNNTLLERNFIKLIVQFKKPGVEFRKATPTVSFPSFTGEVGGLLNLWIGFTFYTLLEMMECVSQCIRSLWMCRRDKPMAM